MSDLLLDAKGIKISSRAGGITFQGKKNQIVSVVGKKGSGKSLLLKILSCQLGAESGELYLFSLNAKNHHQEIKQKTGFVPQIANFDSAFNVFNNLTSFASYYNVDRGTADRKAIELLRLVGLEQKKDSSVDELTPLQIKKLLLIRSLMHNPSILFVDSPTLHLEKDDHNEIWTLIQKIKPFVEMILIATRDANTVTQISNVVIGLEDFSPLFIGEPRALLAKLVGHRVIIHSTTTSGVAYYLNRLREKNYSCQAANNTIHVHLAENEDETIAWQILPHTHWHIREPNLNDLFFKLVLEKKAQGHL